MIKKRSKFDWSLLDRKDLIKYLYNFNSEICEKRISVSKFHKLLTRHLKSRMPIIVTKKIEKTARINELYIGGSYYSDLDKSRRRCIEILVFYSLDKTINVSKYNYRHLCIQIADTILHEIMHMRQHRRRNFKLLPDYASTAESGVKRREQEYLGNTDEIDAYSFNIACVLMQKYKGNTRKAANYLNYTGKKSPKTNPSWTMYLDVFDNNHAHPIIRRLKKKIIRYFPNAQEGKPYRGKDWINR